MTTYFFHIRDDDRLIRDEEGLDLPNVAAARKEAALSAHNLVAEAIGTDEPLDHVAIEIWDDQHLVEVVHLGVLVTGPRSSNKPSLEKAEKAERR
jgi:hypothetical protein